LQGHGVQLVGVEAEYQFLLLALQNRGEVAQFGFEPVGGVAAGGDQVTVRVHHVDLKELVFAGDPR